ncbi:unnamed protein product [Symbiodinium necroappetens]|uniref:Uncharacterized protein n=1 Tax=Symbiodinium necroappetens TaxID=1628268 RepID=A0A812YMS8_9DINO|nr:unnamed protein product [Symbiodinium necroappetens]
MTSRPNFYKRCVPLALHGDGVPLTGVGKSWQNTITDFSFYSLLGEGKTPDLLMFVYCLFDKLRKMGRDSTATAHRFFEILRWSFRIIWSGTWPSHDYNGRKYKPGSEEAKKAGKPLADGWYGILFSFCGDLDYYHSLLDLPNSRTASGPCTLCRTTKYGPLSWQDYRSTAGWRTTCHTPASWSAQDDKSSCPLFGLPFVTGVNVCYDWLHCKYVGSDQYMYGALLRLLCFHVLADTAEKNMQAFWSRLKYEYKRHGTPIQFRYLNTIKMFLKKTGVAKLRGKAAEIKYLAAPFSAVWEHFKNPHLSLHADISLLLKLNKLIEDILIERKGEVSLGEDATRFEEALNAFLSLQSKVASCLQEASGENMMAITEKAHFLQHSAMLSKYLSPRLVWVFGGEDQQRRVQCLGKSAVKGNGPTKAVLKMVSKYRMALHFQFQTHDG